MDYIGIVKKAYHITIKNKFLWIFAILAGGYGGFRGFNTSNLTSYSTNNNDYNKLSSYLNGLDLATFWDKFGSAVITIGVILFIFAIIMFILNLISQGALIGSVAKINKDEKSNFKDGFKIGWHNFWRVWGVGIIYLLMILASLIVLIVPVAVSLIAGGYIFGIIWGILLFFVCLAFWILIGLISPYSFRVVVLEKKSVWQSIRESLHFFRDNWVSVVVMYLFLFGISLVFSLVLVLAILLIGAILLLIGYGLYLASYTVAIFYAIMAVLGFFIAIIVATGAFNSFYSTSITLTYQKLKES